jgi:hypothetical protein
VLNLPALKLLRKTPERSAERLHEIARSTDEPLAWAQFVLIAEQRLEAVTDSARHCWTMRFQETYPNPSF